MITGENMDEIDLSGTKVPKKSATVKQNSAYLNRSKSGIGFEVDVSSDHGMLRMDGE